LAWSIESDYISQVEMGSKNHEVVPVVLIVQISGLRSGGVNKLLGELAKRNLVAKVRNAKCESFYIYIFDLGFGETRRDLFFSDDGYRLTYGGYDFLAMRAMSKRDTLHSVGNQIGVGKESGKCFVQRIIITIFAVFNLTRSRYLHRS
jgi:RIO kinase 2